MTDINDIEESLQKLGHALGTDGQLIENVMTRIEAVNRSSRAGTKNRGLIVRMFSMQHFTKLAAAAVLTIGILLGISYLGISQQSLAWAEVQEKIGQIDYFTFHQRQFEKMVGENEYRETSHNVIAVSQNYGQRIDSYKEEDPNFSVEITTYASIKNKELVGIIHPMKAYTRSVLPESAIESMKEANVRATVEKWLSGNYKKLGSTVINDCEVEGIEVSDPTLIVSDSLIQKFIGYLWVDVKTKLPVLLEIELSTTDQGNMKEIIIIADQFNWNVIFTPEIFEPNIPSDYILIPEK